MWALGREYAAHITLGDPLPAPSALVAGSGHCAQRHALLSCHLSQCKARGRSCAREHDAEAERSELAACRPAPPTFLAFCLARASAAACSAFRSSTLRLSCSRSAPTSMGSLCNHEQNCISKEYQKYTKI